MKIEEIKHSVKNIIFSNSANELGGSCYITKSLSNCKFSTIDSIGSLIHPVEKEKSITNFIKVLEKCSILVGVNTTCEKIRDFIVENFDVYAVNTIPIGYWGGNQYHIFIKNKYAQDGRLEYLRNLPKTKKDLTLTKENIIKLFKQKRRKTDIVEDIIKCIQ